MSSILKSRFLRIYVVPGAVFQSVTVGGGYGTGREIVEYFTSYGALGGLYGFGIAFLTFAIVLSLTFELSRQFRAYDYRNFFKHLLGRAWITYEVLIILLFVLVLSILASAAGNILRDNFEVSYGVGLILMLAAIGFLTFFGRNLITTVLTFWSVFLYVVFATVFIVVFLAKGPLILSNLGAKEIVDGWQVSGFKYGVYNLATVPLLLYVVRDFETPSESIISAVIAALITLVPAVTFHLLFFADYPAILDQPIPVYWLLKNLGTAGLLVIYSVMLFGTFIETGAGMLQGINERIDSFVAEKRGAGLSRSTHAAIAVTAVILSATLSTYGIVNLIAKGYGTMAWVFFAIYVMPLITVGLYKVAFAGHE